MSASVRASGLSKVFTLAEKGDSAVSLLEALRLGKQRTHTRVVRALENVSFSIDEGERVGVIGANGAGKTTLLSILAGLSEPTSGVVEVEGDVHAMLTIGAVLREDLTGRENIYLDAGVHGRNKVETDAVAEEIVQFTELGEFIDRPVRTYSSGMKSRLAFSMGAFIDPDILILDETLSAGDVFFAQKASRRMHEVAQQGRIVIVVTHSTAVIVNLCTRCLWLENGKLVMDGDPKEVTSAYEASVRNTDEAALKRKFGADTRLERQPQIGALEAVHLLQDGARRQAAVKALSPVTIQIAGALRESAIDCDLQISLLRVDGRKVWHTSLQQAGYRLPDNGPFDVRVTMEPFILGADLYRLDVHLIADQIRCDAALRVFEVIDEEGQFGGAPQLFYPPTIKSRKMTEAKS